MNQRADRKRWRASAAVPLGKVTEYGPVRDVFNSVMVSYLKFSDFYTA